MKKFMVFAISVLVLLSLTGCVLINSDMSGLLRAPKIPKESLQLQSALDKAIGTDAKYVFPQSGKYKSSIIQFDINNDKEDEAIVFYFSDKKGKTARIIILDKVNNQWQTIRDIEGHGSDIDIVNFCDFNGDGRQELIIGWQLYTSQGKGLSVYDIYSGAGVKEIYSTAYTEMLLMKNAVATAPALLTINLNTHKKASVAKLTMFRNKELTDIASCETDGSLSSHKQVIEAYISSDKKGIIIDGEASGLYSTQILFWDGKTLTNPYYKDKRLSDSLKRHTNLLSTDIDRDGIIEIPKNTALPNINIAEKNNSQLSVDLITWNEWDASKILKFDFSSVMNTSQRYYFIFPESFGGRVTVKNDTVAEKFVFYLINNGGTSEELFSISCLDLNDWTHRNEQGGWTELKRESGRVFAASRPRIQSGNALAILSSVDLSKNFIIMTSSEGQT